MSCPRSASCSYLQRCCADTSQLTGAVGAEFAVEILESR